MYYEIEEVITFYQKPNFKAQNAKILVELSSEAPHIKQSMFILS